MTIPSVRYFPGSAHPKQQQRATQNSCNFKILSQNHPPQRRRAASTAHPEQVSRTVESDQSSTLLPLSDLKTKQEILQKKRSENQPKKYSESLYRMGHNGSLYVLRSARVVK